MLILNEIQEWFFVIISMIPGNIGILIRRLVFKLLLKKSYKVSIGRNCKILSSKNISLSNRINIGENSFITAQKGKLVIGEYSIIGMNSHINADHGEIIEIGSNCIMGPNLLIRSANHNYKDQDRLIRNQGHSPQKILIEDNVWIGANVSIVGKTVIKSGSVVAAGSVLTKEYNKKSLIAGNPAEIIKEL